MNVIRRIGRSFSPIEKSDEGRDQWPSRAGFLLAAVGGAIGMGNLLRYPSVVFNNHGLQWFIPYLMAIFIIAIPGLILEVAIGQAYQGGTVVAYNHMNKRLKGTGMGLLFIGFVVSTYFNTIVAWIMTFFRHSFQSPLPWQGRSQEFYVQNVLRRVEPIEGSLSADGSSVLSYTQYPGTGIVGEVAGWSAFVWFLTWLCIFQGVAVTGRVVYFTMGLPVVMTIILIGRSVSLPNAGEGVKLYFATWNGGKLASSGIWQAACGQVFFSTGVGFGYYTAYASYNRKFANAVQDAIIIVCSNASFEAIAAFAVFGVVGYLGLDPDSGETLAGSFDVGFVTYPEALAEMPAAPFWAVIFFLTLLFLGVSSAFAMIDAIVTLVMDMSPKLSRPLVVTSLITMMYLLSLPYCTEFGYYHLNGIDAWTSNMALIFVVWSECVTSTTVYRWKDVVSQVGVPAFVTYNVGYFGGQIFGVAVGHAVSPSAGAGLGFGLFIAGTAIALLIAKSPDSRAPRFWGRNLYTSRLWYMAFYSVRSRRDRLCLQHRS